MRLSLHIPPYHAPLLPALICDSLAAELILNAHWDRLCQSVGHGPQGVPPLCAACPHAYILAVPGTHTGHRQTAGTWGRDTDRPQQTTGTCRGETGGVWVGAGCSAGGNGVTCRLSAIFLVEFSTSETKCEYGFQNKNALCLYHNYG
jgi:hypothetical protein